MYTHIRKQLLILFLKSLSWAGCGHDRRESENNQVSAGVQQMENGSENHGAAGKCCALSQMWPETKGCQFHHNHAAAQLTCRSRPFRGLDPACHRPQNQRHQTLHVSHIPFPPPPHLSFSFFGSRFPSPPRRLRNKRKAIRARVEKDTRGGCFRLPGLSLSRSFISLETDSLILKIVLCSGLQGVAGFRAKTEASATAQNANRYLSLLCGLF